MIDRERRFIFVHIPRTGGTSVEQALFPSLEGRDRRKHLYGLPNPYQEGELQHLRAKHIRQEVGGNLFARCFKFSFVRNPWEKAVSQYAFLRRMHPLRRQLGIAEANPLRRIFRLERMVPFREYIRLIHASPASHVHWAEQHEFIADDRGQIVDFIGRFERLQHDFDTVCDAIGVPRRRLPHENRTRHRRYEEYYDGECREIVAQMYARDIELFGYEFGA